MFAAIHRENGKIRVAGGTFAAEFAFARDEQTGGWRAEISVAASPDFSIQSKKVILILGSGEEVEARHVCTSSGSTMVLEVAGTDRLPDRLSIVDPRQVFRVAQDLKTDQRVMIRNGEVVPA